MAWEQDGTASHADLPGVAFTQLLLQRSWGVGVELIVDPEIAKEKELPILGVHDMGTHELDPLVPYYVVEYDNGLKQVMLLLSSVKDEVDPMFG